MKCAWKEFLSIIPQNLRADVDKLGREDLQELRLRLGQSPQLIRSCGESRLQSSVTSAELSYTINAASRYSPWAAASISQGYLTAPGGHRIGIAGEVVVRDGQPTTIKNITSLCIRVARDFPGLASKAEINDSLLILGPPGSGKTTFLRDLIRKIADKQCVAVVDQRGEIFPPAADYLPGKQMDVLTGCDKTYGIDMALRTLGPAWIAMDEITSEADCNALLRAGWCGVKLLATAHAADTQDIFCRPVYRPLVQTRLFQTAIVMRPDKTWKLERMKL